jgi:hypothetical protein
MHGAAAARRASSAFQHGRELTQAPIAQPAEVAFQLRGRVHADGAETIGERAALLVDERGVLARTFERLASVPQHSLGRGVELIAGANVVEQREPVAGERDRHRAGARRQRLRDGRRGELGAGVWFTGHRCATSS